MSTKVLQLAGYAQQSGKKWHIAPAVILGLIEQESGGDVNAVGVPTAYGRAIGSTQFIPPTARTYHVKQGDGRSQVEGAAHYLHDLGFNKDPVGVLQRYSGNTPNYGHDVLAKAKRYGALGHLPATAPDSPAPSAQPGPGPATDGTFLDKSKRSGLVTALLTVTVVLAGAMFIYLGVNLATGGAVSHARKAAAAAVPK